jgi:hypothetical protein
MTIGNKGNYYWIEWQDGNKFLKNLLSDFPQLVLGKYLVNTSFASGSLTLPPEEISQGWFAREKFTFSPQITNVDSIFGYGYDEWYVFDSPKTFDNCEVFINYWQFSLDDAEPEEIQNSFWKQLERLNPESYLANGDNLICATRNENLFNQISQLQFN